MQVLTSECVTVVEVSVRASSSGQNATIAWHKAELVRWSSQRFGYNCLPMSFDRAAVLENSDRTTSHARRPRTKQIRARV
jgi:hypothetical protein